MFLSLGRPASTITTSYSYSSSCEMSLLLLYRLWSLMHHGHQLPPHWISTRRFSFLALANASAICVRASAASSYGLGAAGFSADLPAAGGVEFAGAAC